MNRGFYGRMGIVGMGYASMAGGMGVSPFPIPPSLYQLSPSPSTTVAEHSSTETMVAAHTDVAVAVEFDA
jgi:hypothetical protein